MSNAVAQVFAWTPSGDLHMWGILACISRGKAIASYKLRVSRMCFGSLDHWIIRIESLISCSRKVQQ